MADLKEKVVLVTGASHGVGRGIAEGLAEAGATLYLTTGMAGHSGHRLPGSLEATSATVESLGGRPLPLAVDHNEDEAVLEAFRRIESECGRLDVLVNNAFQAHDTTVRSGAFWEHPFDVWDAQCGPGLRSTYVASALAARLMVEQGTGLIVTLSDNGDDDGRSVTAHGVCSAGMDRMMADMARELKGSGVTALSLAPGVVQSEQLESGFARGRIDPDRRVHRSPRFVGRCVAALSMDPDIADKAGGRFDIEVLRKEYRFSELEEAPV